MTLDMDRFLMFLSYCAHELLTWEFVNSQSFQDFIPREIRTNVNEILKKKSRLSLLISGDLTADRPNYLARDS